MMNEARFEITDLDLSQAQTLGFSWLSSQPAKKTFSVKELAHLILLYLEKEDMEKSTSLLTFLLSLQNQDGSFGNLRDTARAGSLLFTIAAKKISLPPFVFQAGNETLSVEAIKTAANNSLLCLMSQKERWDEDIYDVVYILSALGDAGVFEPAFCLNLCVQDAPERQHPGTTALIITALQKQKNLSQFSASENDVVSEFIQQKTAWLISVQEKDGLKYPATGNLVLHALILCGEKKQALKSLFWLLRSQNENGSWENDINTTALSLLTL